MNSPDKFQNIWDINIKCSYIAILSSGELFSKNCGEKKLYFPSANVSLNWQMVFQEYILEKRFDYINYTTRPIFG